MAHGIRAVTVHLMDVTGSSGAADNRCGIAVTLNSGKTLRTRNVNTQVIAAFYFALDRAARAVRRELERRRRCVTRRRGRKV
jgi:ribosome-associated translation inhibitor RaiA